MRSSNPVLNRAEAFAPAQGYQGYPPPGYYGPGGPQDQYGAGTQPQAVPGRMTIDDVIAKSGILMVIMVLAAAATWNFLPPTLYFPALIGSSIVGFITAMIVSMRRSIPVAGVIAYAIIEGIFVGTFSVIVERGLGMPGIVTQAVIGTFAAAGVTLAAYKYLGVRVQGRLAKIVVTSIIAYAIVMLVNFVLVLAGINIGISTIGAGAGMLAWLAAGLGVVLAVASLLMDFDVITNGVRNGAPESESWRAAFGLLVTMVWLYTNILRILSYLRN